jgi:NAD(P)-dependent dehydrogenase (short-subunit alcohol dehydrogenase family)
MMVIQIINSKFDPLPLSNLQLAINVNILGTINLVRLLVPHIAQLPASLDPGHESERGVIVLVSSAAAYDGQAGSLAYAATKGAIRSVTLPLARDLSRYGIRAVSIAPNMFETPMTSKDKMPEKLRRNLENTFEFPRRSGRPAEEFGGLVMEIMRNRMLNGCDVRIDGGTRLAKL